MFHRLMLATCAVTVLTCQPAIAQDPATIQGSFINNEGREIGTVSVRGTGNGLVARIDVAAGGLTPGWHGLHMHQVADCSDSAKFEKAKAHAKHEGQAHGFLSAEGPEAGDLPNISAGQDGSAMSEATSFLASLSGEKNILDEDGFAVVIHAKEDDYRDSKSAGARVACAEMRGK
jgi:superoxide dismutase, Cu-Zn family